MISIYPYKLCQSQTYEITYQSYTSIEFLFISTKTVLESEYVQYSKTEKSLKKLSMALIGLNDTFTCVGPSLARKLLSNIYPPLNTRETLQWRHNERDGVKENIKAPRWWSLWAHRFSNTKKFPFDDVIMKNLWIVSLLSQPSSTI